MLLGTYKLLILTNVHPQLNSRNADLHLGVSLHIAIHLLHGKSGTEDWIRLHWALLYFSCVRIFLRRRSQWPVHGRDRRLLPERASYPNFSFPFLDCLPSLTGSSPANPGQGVAQSAPHAALHRCSEEHRSRGDRREDGGNYSCPPSVNDQGPHSNATANANKTCIIIVNRLFLSIA